MQKFKSVAAAAVLIAAVSACKKSEPAPAPSEAAAPAVTEAAPTPEAAYTPTAGTYVSTTTDGKPVDTTTLNADGSYRIEPVKGMAEAGLWKMAEDGKICMDPSGKAPAVCYTLSKPGADGSITATSPDGIVHIVKPKA